MLKISEEHTAAFKDLEERDRTIQGVISRVMAEASVLQRALQTDAKALWKDVMETHGIEGNWRHDNGKLFPVAPPDDQAQGDQASRAV